MYPFPFKLLTLSLFMCFSHAVFSSIGHPVLSAEKIAGIEQHAQRWINEQIIGMEPEDIQLTANLLYLLYAGSVIEYTVRSVLPTFISHAWNIRKEIDNYHTCTSEFKTFGTTANNLRMWSNMRHTILQNLQVCETYIDKQASEAVQCACEHIKNEGKQQLCRYATKNKQTLHQDIQNTLKRYHDIGEFVRTAGNMLNGLCSDYPLTTNEQFKTIKQIESASRVADQSVQYAATINEASTHITHHMLELIQVSTIIYVSYYKALCEFMQQNVEPNFITCMVTPEGIIPKSLRTELLPHPEKIVRNFIQ